VQWGTHPHQRTVTGTLGTLSDVMQRAGVTAPVITIIGPVVGLREEIAWFDRRPLFGKRIVVTRARSQAASLSERLRAAGAEVLEMPATQIQPADSKELESAVERLGEYGWVIFTSQNAVRFFWNALRSLSLDARALAHLKIAAVGPATSASLLDCGLAVDLAPDRFVAEALLDAMRDRRDVRGVRVLYVAAEGARETLQDGLEELGALVDRVVAYRSVVDGAGADELRGRLLAGGADLVTFTSASSVNAFVGAVGADAAARAPAASIGPITSQAARENKLSVAIEAASSTIPGLVDAICEHFAPSAVGAHAAG
jgi:uroporphyrinogen III methyltransferase/synthase